MTVEKNNESDRDIWNRYIAGSDEALTELFNKYNSRLVARLAGNGCAHPEELVQDVWTKVISKRDSFDGRSFSGWIFTITNNMGYAQHRKSNRRNESNLDPEFELTNKNEGLLGIARLEQKEMVQMVKDCMESVGKPFVTAFRLKLDGLKASEIAAKEGIAEGTADSRAGRAKAKIRECVEGKTSEGKTS